MDLNVNATGSEADTQSATGGSASKLVWQDHTEVEALHSLSGNNVQDGMSQAAEQVTEQAEEPDVGQDDTADAEVRERLQRLADIPVPLREANAQVDCHSRAILIELSWLKAVLSARIASYFEERHILAEDFPPPILDANSHYAGVIQQYGLVPQQRLILSLALAAELMPDILDILQSKNTLYDLPYAEFGGLVNQSQPGFLPTVQTALYLLAGADVTQNMALRPLLNPGHVLFAEELLALPAEMNQNNILQWPLTLTSACREQIFHGQEVAPEFSAAFPAKAIETNQSWQDVVLHPTTAAQLDELQLWLKHRHILETQWRVSAAGVGYKALFYGPPGTGKTLTASVLAKALQQPIFKVELSQVVSKFIGETEKNLEKVFRRASQKDWILFFDEADALFSKRGAVNTANDRHANQEVAYLLQRIETCSNMVILATNLKDNMDEAFLRRFQAIIHFPRPDANQRQSLWQKGFSREADVSELDLIILAQDYDLSGAEINNVIRFASLKAIDRGTTKIDYKDVITAIRREKFKEGRYV